MIKNTRQILIQDLHVNSVTNSVVEYDHEFIILLPHTIITEDILKIFQHTYLNVLSADESLSLNDNTKDLPDNDDGHMTQADAIDTTDITVLTDNNKFLEQNDPYIIAHTYTEYNTLYESAYNLLFNFYEKGVLIYKDIQEFVCTQIVPRIKKCPYPYLAIGNMPSDSKRDRISEITFKYLLFTLAILEQDEFEQPFFRSIDKRIEMAICAFLSYISATSIEKQINKTIDFTNPKARDILIKISAQTLRKKHFPSYVIDVISHMKPYRSQIQSIQYEQVYNEVNIVANLLTIVDYYIQSITLNQNTPFQTLKTIIDDRYNFYTENIKCFTKSIGIVPVGLHVKLRNGCYGIISHSPKKTPKMPEVHLVTDKMGNPQKSFRYVKSQESEFNITEIPSYEIGVQITKTYLNMLKSKYQ